MSVDDVELFTLSETKKDVMRNDIQSEILDDDLKRRLQYIVTHKYEQCFLRLKKEWEPKLAALGAKSIPTDPDEFAQLVFSSPGYKNRSRRDLDSITAAALPKSP